MRVGDIVDVDGVQGIVTAVDVRSTTVRQFDGIETMYGIGAQILRDLGVGQMKLLARPRKMPSMAGFGLHTTGFVES